MKSGTIPLPGVSITATNTLTGQKYSTTTDANGAYSMTIPANGRYVLKTDLIAFAPVTKEVLLTAGAAPATQSADFSLILASHAEQQTGRPPGNFRRYAGARAGAGGTGTQNLDLLEALAGAADAGTDTGAAGAALPSLANNADFSDESVAVSGEAGNTSPFAGIDMDALRQTAEANGLGGGPGGGGPGGGGRRRWTRRRWAGRGWSGRRSRRRGFAGGGGFGGGGAAAAAADGAEGEAVLATSGI